MPSCWQATAVRFHRLGAQSLWYDEGRRLRAFVEDAARAHSAFADLMCMCPPISPLLGLWQDLTGSSEFALRIAFGSIQHPQHRIELTHLGARLFHPIAGLAAAALVALNSFSIYYAQEARMYAMLSALAAAAACGYTSVCIAPADLGKPTRRSFEGDQNHLDSAWLTPIGMYTHVASRPGDASTQAALVGTDRFCASLYGLAADPARDQRLLRWQALDQRHAGAFFCHRLFAVFALAAGRHQTVERATGRIASQPLAAWIEMLRRDSGTIFAFGSAY